MKIYTLNTDNSISVYGSKQEAATAQTGETFAGENDLGLLTSDLPLSRLVDTWNGIPGVDPVKKFEDRKTAVARIWAAIQGFTPPVTPQAACHAPKKSRAGKKAAKAAKCGYRPRG